MRREANDDAARDHPIGGDRVSSPHFHGAVYVRICGMWDALRPCTGSADWDLVREVGR